MVIQYVVAAVGWVGGGCCVGGDVDVVEELRCCERWLC